MEKNGDQYGFRFRDWDIYNDSLTFRQVINDVVVSFPSDERYALVDQTKRALNSIVLNIAEGSNKNTDKDTRVYINRAHCSLDEVIACMDCALRDRYINKNTLEKILMNASVLAKKLNGFSNYLKRPQVKD